MTSVPILLLEDDPLIRDLLEAVLSDEGHEVRACSSRDQLLTAASSLPGALAVVDFWGTSHRDLSDDERQEVVDLAQAVPTILVTGRTWAEHEVADDLGCVAIIGKPFDVDQVVEVVSSSVAQLRADTTTARAQANRLSVESEDALSR